MENGFIYSCIGDLYFKEKKYNSAKDYYLKAVNFNRNYYRYLENTGECFFNKR